MVSLNILLLRLFTLKPSQFLTSLKFIPYSCHNNIKSLCTKDINVRWKCCRIIERKKVWMKALFDWKLLIEWLKILRCAKLIPKIMNINAVYSDKLLLRLYVVERILIIESVEICFILSQLKTFYHIDNHHAIINSVLYLNRTLERVFLYVIRCWGVNERIVFRKLSAYRKWRWCWLNTIRDPIERWSINDD